MLSSICTWSVQLQNKSSSWNEIPEREVILYGYLFTIDLRQTCTPKYFWSNTYISNVCRFTKSALRMLLLSTFRVSRINYYLVCSLLIHTRRSANAEGPRAHCQLKSRKMLYKCSTDCIWKGTQPVNGLQGHSRSLPLLPFDRPYTISYRSSVVSIYPSCTIFEILTLICQKN